MTTPTLTQALDALDSLVRQLVETAAYDDARKGEDPGLLQDVANAWAVLDQARMNEND